MELVGSLDTSVTLHNTPEERRSHSHRSRSLISRKAVHSEPSCVMRTDGQTYIMKLTVAPRPWVTFQHTARVDSTHQCTYTRHHRTQLCARECSIRTAEWQANGRADLQAPQLPGCYAQFSVDVIAKFVFASQIFERWQESARTDTSYTSRVA
jgi:hypothetical protein